MPYGKGCGKILQTVQGLSRQQGYREFDAELFVACQQGNWYGRRNR